MTTTESHPLIAVTMGDPAGVGPEITIGALVDERVTSTSRPVVVGDVGRLSEAAGILGLSPEINVIEDPAEGRYADGVINVIQVGSIGPEVRWGELSAEAGEAAYRYVERAASLAVEGRVAGICTAPLNKAALHAAGHLFPGHTELLAHLTGTAEVSMLLSTPQLKVIHVTTHIGLIDAVRTIEPDLVERTIRRGSDAMRGAGIERPRIAVCAINPHAGENGLFGYGEEAEKIAPGITAAVASGIDAVGPLPADTAFYLASRGDYDLVVAMYHDQGHGPIKVMGIEAGTNITVGLPVVRSSVDHGTAFDIAGTGRAGADSMVQAMLQAAELSRGVNTSQEG